MPEENQHLRGDISDLRSEVGDLSRSNAKIEATTAESNRRLATIEAELKHAVKNFQTISQAVGLLDQRVKDQNLKITALDEGKADRDDVEELKKKIEGTEAMIKGALGKGLMMIGATAAAYIASKLGISIPGLH